jgi:CDP-diglyceride synthetase
LVVDQGTKSKLTMRVLGKRTYIAVPLGLLVAAMFALHWFIFVFAPVGIYCLIEVITVRRVQTPTLNLPYPRLIQACVVIGGTASACVMYQAGGVWRDITMATMLAVIAADIFALLGGMVAERFLSADSWWVRRPVQRVSSGKTNTGFVSGYVFGAIVFTLVGVLTQIPLVIVLVLALLVPAMGEIGDLVASAVKRSIGVKDFALWHFKPLLRSHGGGMDRLDSHHWAYLFLGLLCLVVMLVLYLI